MRQAGANLGNLRDGGTDFRQPLGVLGGEGTHNIRQRTAARIRNPRRHERIEYFAFGAGKPCHHGHAARREDHLGAAHPHSPRDGTLQAGLQVVGNFHPHLARLFALLDRRVNLGGTLGIVRRIARAVMGGGGTSGRVVALKNNQHFVIIEAHQRRLASEGGGHSLLDKLRYLCLLHTVDILSHSMRVFHFIVPRGQGHRPRTDNAPLWVARWGAA